MNDTNAVLFRAAQHGDWDECKQLLSDEKLQLKMDDSSRDNRGRTIFHLAVFRGGIELVRMMLERGSNPRLSCRNLDYCSISANAVMWSAMEGRRGVLELLLQKGGKFKKSPKEMRGICEVSRGNFREAATHFFGPRSGPHSPVQVMRAYLKAIRRNATSYKSVDLQILFRRAFHKMLESQLLDEEDFVEIIEFFALETRFNFLEISAEGAGILYKFMNKNPTVGSMCRAAEILCYSRFNNLRKMFYLHTSIRIIIEYMLSRECPKDLLTRLSAAIEGLGSKDKLLLDSCDQHLKPDTIRFLINSCNCNPNYKDRYGQTLIYRVWRVEQVRALLDCGAHPCARSFKGIPAFESVIPEFGIRSGVRTLQCIAATKITEARIEYRKLLPPNIHGFMELH